MLTFTLCFVILTSHLKKSNLSNRQHLKYLTSADAAIFQTFLILVLGLHLKLDTSYSYKYNLY